jgi:hypothetical protein
MQELLDVRLQAVAGIEAARRWRGRSVRRCSAGFAQYGSACGEKNFDACSRRIAIRRREEQVHRVGIFGSGAPPAGSRTIVAEVFALKYGVPVSTVAMTLTSGAYCG